MKSVLLLLCFISILAGARAQSYQWIKGGGSTEGMNPMQTSTWERTTNMCTDDNGNIYITALVGSTSIQADTFYEALAHNVFLYSAHILVASYRCDGTMRWAKLLEGNEDTYVGRSYLEVSNGALACSKGSLYMVGAFICYTKYIGHDTTFSSNQESFTARFDTLGNFKWIRFLGPDSPSTSLLTGDPGVLAIDGEGYIHNFNYLDSTVLLSPAFTTPTTGTYDLKYDSSGNLISANKLHMDSTFMLTRVIFDKPSGKYYAMIWPDWSYAMWDSRDNYGVCAFSPDGTQLWTDTTGFGRDVAGFDYKGGNALYVAGQGNYPDTFAFGGMSVTDTLHPLYNVAVVARLDTNGVARWIYNVQGNESINEFDDVTILPNGSVAAIGAMVGTDICNHDTLISTPGEQINPMFAVIDSNGHTVKLDQFHGSGYDDDGTLMTSDAVGNVYAGGMVENDMAATGLTPYTSHGGNTDFFFLKYGYDCACSVAPAAAFTYSGVFPHITFTYTGSVTAIDSIVWSYGDGHRDTGFNPLHTYAAAGTYTVCVTVYTECGNNTSCATVAHTTGLSSGLPGAGQILIYPNPADNMLVIENAAIGSRAELYNMTGQQVQSAVINSNSQELNVKNLIPAMYILQLTDGDGNRMKRTILKK